MNLEDQLHTAQNEIRHWKHVAAYLASCHAATLEGMPKSTPKSARKRQTNICTEAGKYLRGKSTPPFHGPGQRGENVLWEAERCESAVAKYGQAAESPTTG